MPTRSARPSRCGERARGLLWATCKRFRAAAARLAELEPARDLPPEVHLQLGPMRWEARVGADARTNEAAAQAAAEVARTCGDCHVANRVGTAASFVARGAAPLSSSNAHRDGLSGIMTLLWDGLVGPSEASWSVGARSLAEAGSLSGSQLASIPERDVVFAAGRLQRLAAEAAAAPDADYRVRALSEIWGTCSECHTRTRSIRRP